jgi:hypothetical protein
METHSKALSMVRIGNLTCKLATITLSRAQQSTKLQSMALQTGHSPSRLRSAFPVPQPDIVLVAQIPAPRAWRVLLLSQAQQQPQPIAFQLRLSVSPSKCSHGHLLLHSQPFSMRSPWLHLSLLTLSSWLGRLMGLVTRHYFEFESPQMGSHAQTQSV